MNSHYEISLLSNGNQLNLLTPEKAFSSLDKAYDMKVWVIPSILFVRVTLCY